jgi:DNA polymerase-3 subunit beta
MPLSKETLLMMMESVEHAIAKQDVRYYLNGLMIECSKERGMLSVCATDGHRLAIRELPMAFDADPALLRQVIIPGDSLPELKRVLQGPGDCALSLNENHVCIANDTVTLITKLIDGKFPDVQRVIPSHSPLVVRVPREALIDAINRVGLVLEKETGLSFTLKEHAVQLMGKYQSEESEDEVSVEYYGDPITIGLNHRYLLDALRSFDSETVVCGLTDATSAIKIEGESDEGIRVIMCMRL